MKELLEEYVLEAVSMRQEINLLLRIITELDRAIENEMGDTAAQFELEDLKHVKPAPVRVEDGTVYCG